jgi:hypothetical protein
LILNGRPWINEKSARFRFSERAANNSKAHTFSYRQMPADILDTIPRRNVCFIYQLKARRPELIRKRAAPMLIRCV